MEPGQIGELQMILLSPNGHSRIELLRDVSRRNLNDLAAGKTPDWSVVGAASDYVAAQTLLSDIRRKLREKKHAAAPSVFRDSEDPEKNLPNVGNGGGA